MYLIELASMDVANARGVELRRAADRRRLAKQVERENRDRVLIARARAAR